MSMWWNRGIGLFGPGWQPKSKLASKLATKVQAGNVQVTERSITNIVHRKTVALEVIIIRNAGAAARL
jgi:hypothetical protein